MKSLYRNYMKLFTAICLGIMLMSVTISCTQTAKPLETAPYFIGFITEIHPVGEGTIKGQISVESHADKLVEKYIVTINNDTLIFLQDEANIRQESFQSLVVKQWIKIWFSGPILESYPMQGTAEQIIVSEKSW